MRILAVFATAAAVIALTVSGVSAQLAPTQLKIGYINSAEILEKYSCAKDAEAKLKKEIDKWGIEVQKRETELKSLQEQLEKQSMLLTMERKKELADSLQEKYRQYQEYGQKKQSEAMEKRVEYFKPVEDSVNRLIQKVGKDENYDIIFDAINGRVVYALEKYDLTKRIVEILPACSVAKSTGGAPAVKKEAETSKKK